MALLISYLKSLSSQFSPGVSDTTLRFATVITDDVSLEDRDAMLRPLENYVAYRTNARQSLMAKLMLPSGKTAFKRLSLSLWLLKGPPETWRGQLEEYYRKEPVFALLAGITKGEWQPIHKFSEDNHIPCILPITDFPVISETDWYTLYFSKGLYQEGESAARYLNGMDAPLLEKSIVQIVRDSREGRVLLSGFQETWRGLGRQDPVTVTLKAGETLTGKALEQLLARERPATLIVWDGSEALPALESLPAGKNRPETVLVSSGYLGKSMWTLGEQLRDFTYITYPFRLPQDPYMGNVKVGDDTQIISKQLYTVILLLHLALIDISGQYYRDNLLDVMGMGRSAGMGMDEVAKENTYPLFGRFSFGPGQHYASMGVGEVAKENTYPLYEHFSFGPGQRYASKGCYIVQLTKGPKPELIKKSNWITY